jgi:hypothetical protein
VDEDVFILCLRERNYQDFFSFSSIFGAISDLLSSKTHKENRATGFGVNGRINNNNSTLFVKERMLGQLVC